MIVKKFHLFESIGDAPPKLVEGLVSLENGDMYITASKIQISYSGKYYIGADSIFDPANCAPLTSVEYLALEPDLPPFLCRITFAKTP